jgi:hypothetical protein
MVGYGVPWHMHDVAVMGPAAFVSHCLDQDITNFTDRISPICGSVDLFIFDLAQVMNIVKHVLPCHFIIFHQ